MPIWLLFESDLIKWGSNLFLPSSKVILLKENAVLEYEMQNSAEGAGWIQTLTRAEYK